MSDQDDQPWRGDEEIEREPVADAATPSDAYLPPEVPMETHPETYPPATADYAPAHPGSLPGAQVRASSIACPNCGYNLTGATIGMGCPECGMIVGAGLLGAANMPTTGKAVASMVLGILSILGCMSYGLISIICGPLAIIFARQTKRLALDGGVSPSSESMATAGLVCGIIGTVIGAVAFLVIGGFIVMAIAAGP